MTLRDASSVDVYVAPLRSSGRRNVDPPRSGPGDADQSKWTAKGPAGKACRV